MTLPAGATSATITTSRLTHHYLDKGPSDGIPVVFVHGNLSSARFFDRLIDGAPAGYRLLAPDMRGFGDSDKVAIDATRGLRDWSDDLAAFVQAVGVERPAHFVGWSTGGGAIANLLVDHPGLVASLTLIDPVSPYGFGGTRDADGTPTTDDFAGSGGGAVNPEVVQRLADGDVGDDSDMSPRNVMRAFYWAPGTEIDRAWEDLLTGEMVKVLIGDGGYPGTSTASDNWPGMAPGDSGILNAVSGKWCRWNDIVGVADKPPILWTHGTADLIVGNGSMFDMAVLGQLGAVPGWPGEDACPPQPMLDQIHAVLDAYAAAGGAVRKELFEGSGHGPHVDAEDRWAPLFWEFVGSV